MAPADDPPRTRGVSGGGPISGVPWGPVVAACLLLATSVLVGSLGALPGGHAPGLPMRTRSTPALASGASELAPHLPSTTLNGVDVSSYQGNVNWGAVAGNGVTFAFAKASQGNYYTDPTWVSNAQNGKAAGVYIGAYDFADPVNVGATTEANYFDSVAGPYFTQGYMYPALDLEQGCGTLSRSALSSWVVTWMTTVESYISSHDGYNIVPIVYMNSNYANNCVDSSVTNYHLWIAQYCGGCNPNIGIFSSWNYYQWNDQGTEPGISGYVDQDVFAGGLSALQNGFIFGSSAPTVSYSVVDKTTGTNLYCGDSFSTGDTIQFTATATGGTPPYSFSWNYGDGRTGTGNPVTHVYTALGTVNPTVTVTDSAGKTASSGAGCDFTVTGVTVTFYTLPPTVGAITVGSASFSDGQSAVYPVGATYALSATAPTAYVFSGWNDTGGVSVAGRNAITTTLTTTSAAAATVTVSFITRSAIQFLSSPPGAATAELGGNVYTSGQNITASVGTPYPLLALPSAGYVFVAWQVTGSGIVVQSLNQAWTNITVVSTSPSTLTEVVLWNVPRPPLGLAVTGATPSTLDLAWTPPPGAITSYALGHAPGSAPPSGAPGGFQLTSFGAGGSAYTLTGLAPGTQYWLALSAVNSTGQGGWSPWIPGTTLALPEAPLYLAVDSVGGSYAVLSWQPPAGGASISGYHLDCNTSTPGAVPRSISGIPPSSTIYNVTGLTSGAGYSCTISSLSGSYSSPPSNAVNFDLPAVVQSSPAKATVSLTGLWAVPYRYLLLGALVVLVVIGVLWARKRGRGSGHAPASDSASPAAGLGEVGTPDGHVPDAPPAEPATTSSIEPPSPPEEVLSPGPPVP